MTDRKKGVIIIIDGLGDRPVEAFDRITPLEAADTPNFDRLVAGGACGLVHPFIPGMPVGTHTGTSQLMGLAPADAFDLARGPIEAVGIDLLVQPGDVTLRANFATLEEDNGQLRVLDRRAGRIREGTRELAAAMQIVGVDHGIEASLHAATGHRAVLRLSGPRLSADVTDTDPSDGAAPGARVLPCQSLESDEYGTRTAEAINHFIRGAFEHLGDHPVNVQRRAAGLLPANGIITRGAGMLREVHNFLRHLNLNVAVVAAERTVLGLGKLFHFTCISDPRFTALPNTDLPAKVETALAALDTHDLVFLHVKGTDVHGHDTRPEGKKAMIEKIDHAITPLLDKDIVIGVSADHSTDSTAGRHCGDPVPSVIAARRCRSDSCTSFGEAQCARGGLGRIPANAFLLNVLDNMGCLHNYRTTDARYLRGL